MPRQSTPCAVATLGIDIGKNTFHLLGLDQRGAIVLQLRDERTQRGHRNSLAIDRAARLAAIPAGESPANRDAMGRRRGLLHPSALM